MLPARRPPKRSGIQRAVKRDWPKHEQWLRGFSCAVAGCENRRIECAHLRLRAKDNALARKPPSWFCIPLCTAHHREAHQGELTFQIINNLDWLKLASEFARKSPDLKMREAMKSHG